METLSVRLCLERDLPEIMRLFEQLAEATTSQPALEFENLVRLYAVMKKSPDFYLNLVAILEGRVVGFISIIFYKTLFHRGGTALINELVVDQDLRGKRIGAILVHEAKEEARLRGMDELEVATEGENLAAQGFYRKNGFTEEYILFGMEF